MHRLTPVRIILAAAVLGVLAMFLLPDSASWSGLVVLVAATGAMITHAGFIHRPVSYRHPLIAALASAALFLGMYAFRDAAPLFLLLSMSATGATLYLAARWRTTPEETRP